MRAYKDSVTPKLLDLGLAWGSFQLPIFPCCIGSSILGLPHHWNNKSTMQAASQFNVTCCWMLLSIVRQRYDFLLFPRLCCTWLHKDLSGVFCRRHLAGEIRWQPGQNQIRKGRKICIPFFGVRWLANSETDVQLSQLCCTCRLQTSLKACNAWSSFVSAQLSEWLAVPQHTLQTVFAC